MRKAIEAGYEARQAGRIPRRLYAQASSPDEGLPELAGEVAEGNAGEPPAADRDVDPPRVSHRP
jgi:hypothetical protein